MSLPSRERGLKCPTCINAYDKEQVAPLAGAWIEIGTEAMAALGYSVAPLAGAWIEMAMPESVVLKEPSLPSRERGLKYTSDIS